MAVERETAGGLPLALPEYFRDCLRADGRRRKDLARNVVGNAEEALAGFKRGGSVFLISANQYSMIDLLAVALRKVRGPADVAIWQYMAGKAEAAAIKGWAERGRFRRLRIVFDRSGIHVGQPGLYADLQRELGDCVRISMCHAKMAIISDGKPKGWRILIDGSASMTRNLRFEQANVRDDPGLWAFVNELTDKVFATPRPEMNLITAREASDVTVQTVGAAKRRTASAFGDDFYG